MIFFSITDIFCGLGTFLHTFSLTSLNLQQLKPKLEPSLTFWVNPLN